MMSSLKEGNYHSHLSIRDLVVRYSTLTNDISALRNVDLDVSPSEIVAIVGESGSGKSTLGLSIIHLLPVPPAKYVHGEIFYNGTNLLSLKESQLTNLRGTSISMIFQEPMSSLDPVYVIRDQLMEAIKIRNIRRQRRPSALNEERPANFKVQINSTPEESIEAQKENYSNNRNHDSLNEIKDVLRQVQIGDVESVLKKYPFELSGGMAQRIMIARALLQRPSLLIADEPTSALDVTTQAQVLELMHDLRNKIGTAILFITHDLAVASQIASRVIVMYAGEIIEDSPIEEIFREPLHPYTEGLIGSFAQIYKSEGSANPIAGEIPDLRKIPQGCPFHPRCKYAFSKCIDNHPSIAEVSPNHRVACFLREASSSV